MVEILEEKPLTTNPKINLYGKEDIINRLAKGEPQQSIAKDHNITQTAVSILKSNNKHLVEAKKQELLAKLPTVVETITKDVNTNNQLSTHFNSNIDNLSTQDKLTLKTQLDKTNLNLLKISGIIQPQALINYNLTQDNRTQTTVISPNVLNMFSNHAESLVDTEVIDVIEDTTNDSNGDNVDNS